MDYAQALLIIAALMTFGAFIVRLITRGPKPRNLTRWGSYAIISLIGLSLSTPNAFGREYDEPGTDGIRIVTCDLNDSNWEFVAQAFAKQDPQLFTELGAKCHLPADGIVSKDCALFINNPPIPVEFRLYMPTFTPCFNDTSAVRFAIFDPLGWEQSSEVADIWLNGHHADSMYIYQSMPGELLIISAPKAAMYTYTMELHSYNKTDDCPPYKHRTSLPSTLNARNGSFFVVLEGGCQSPRIWLDDQTALSN